MHRAVESIVCAFASKENERFVWLRRPRLSQLFDVVNARAEFNERVRAVRERFVEPARSDELLGRWTRIVRIEVTEKLLECFRQEVIGNGFDVLRCFAADLRGEHFA